MAEKITPPPTYRMVAATGTNGVDAGVMVKRRRLVSSHDTYRRMNIGLALMILAAEEAHRKNNNGWEKVWFAARTEAERRGFRYEQEELYIYARHFKEGFDDGIEEGKLFHRPLLIAVKNSDCDCPCRDRVKEAWNEL